MRLASANSERLASLAFFSFIVFPLSCFCVSFRSCSLFDTGIRFGNVFSKDDEVPRGISHAKLFETPGLGLQGSPARFGRQILLGPLLRPCLQRICLHHLTIHRASSGHSNSSSLSVSHTLSPGNDTCKCSTWLWRAGILCSRA